MRRRLVVSVLPLAAFAGAILEAPAAAATLSGVVWFDGDRDGQRDRGEAGAKGVRVTVERRGARGRFVSAVTRTTGKGGAWSYPVGKAATLRVRVALPPSASGFTARDRGRRDATDSDVAMTGKARGRSAAVQLRPRGKSLKIDAGLLRRANPGPLPLPKPIPVPPLVPDTAAPAATVGGTAWRDLDGNGVRDGGEPLEAGTTIELWSADRSQLLGSTTAAGGAWSLAAPQPGATYRVRVVLPAGTIYSPDGQGAEDVDSDVLDDGPHAGFSAPIAVPVGTTTVDMGLRSTPAISIGDRIWRDNNADGIQDGGESSTASGVDAIELWNDSLTQRIATTTDTAGIYSLPAVAGGTYRVRFVPAAAWGFAPRDQGPSDFLDSDPGRLGAELGLTGSLRPTGNTTAVDVGVVSVANLGDFVWHDLDGDGVQDAGEPGLPGIAVELWNSDRSVLVDADTTTAAGKYAVQTPFPGDYRIRFALPAGASYSPKFVGSGSFDSDVNTAADLGWTDAITAGTGLISSPGIDAGIVLP